MKERKDRRGKVLRHESAPYQKNDMVTTTIEDIGTDGEGIGRIEGYTLFVKDALPGDTVLVKIMKAKKNYAYARLEKVEVSSPFRVEPKCAFARQCGGCQLQALSYEKQLLFKENKVRNNLIRLGGFKEGEIEAVMEPIVGMEEPYHYRNKAQFPFGYDKEGRIITGFYAGRTHSIIANTDCVLGIPENEQILKCILTYMEENHVSAYQEADHKGLIRHVLIRKGFYSGQLMVCLVINGKKLPKADSLTQKLIKIRGMQSISVSINQEKTNVIMGEEIHTLWGSDTIEDQIFRWQTLSDQKGEKDEFIKTDESVSFCISPLSFYQVNPIQTEKLYSLALEYAGLTGQETVWDLYCGIGTISLFLARHAREVYGVEIVPQAIQDARLNADRNQIDNVRFFIGKAEEVLPQEYEKNDTYADVIVVDPPRKGCNERCLETMLKMQPKRIVYVSCDSATLARDLKVLCAGGYELKRVRAVDQFAQTGHVETICLLSKLNVEHHIEVELNLDEMDLTAAESKATYEEIKAYVKEQTDLQVSNLYIAQVKRKCGIIERVNYNLPKSEDSRRPKCPPEKEEAIKAALKYFKMI